MNTGQKGQVQVGHCASWAPRSAPSLFAGFSHSLGVLSPSRVLPHPSTVGTSFAGLANGGPTLRNQRLLRNLPFYIQGRWTSSKPGHDFRKHSLIHSSIHSLILSVGRVHRQEKVRLNPLYPAISPHAHCEPSTHCQQEGYRGKCTIPTQSKWGRGCRLEPWHGVDSEGWRREGSPSQQAASGVRGRSQSSHSRDGLDLDGLRQEQQSWDRGE